MEEDNHRGFAVEGWWCRCLSALCFGDAVFPRHVDRKRAARYWWHLLAALSQVYLLSVTIWGLRWCNRFRALHPAFWVWTVHTLVHHLSLGSIQLCICLDWNYCLDNHTDVLQVLRNTVFPLSVTFGQVLAVVVLIVDRKALLAAPVSLYLVAITLDAFVQWMRHDVILHPHSPSPVGRV